MKKSLPNTRAVAVGLPLLVALAATACGGTMTFEGQKPFTVTGKDATVTPPPAAPEPKKEVKKKKANIKKNKIEIDEKVQFEYDKAVILPVSHGLLDDVVDILKENPQIKKVLIEGHASSDGDDKHNLDLSDARAKAVQAYLVEKGVDKERLTAKGFGETQPIGDNATEEGREKNRRVEFTIEKTDDKAADKADDKKKDDKADDKKKDDKADDKKKDDKKKDDKKKDDKKKDDKKKDEKGASK